MKDLVAQINRKKIDGLYDDGDILRIHVNARTERGRNHYLTKSVKYKGMDKDEVIKQLVAWAEEQKSHPEHIRWKNFMENKDTTVGEHGRPTRTGIPFLTLSYNTGTNSYRLSVNTAERFPGKTLGFREDNIAEVLVKLDVIRNKLMNTRMLSQEEIEKAAAKIKAHYLYHKANGCWRRLV